MLKQLVLGKMKDNAKAMFSSNKRKFVEVLGEKDSTDLVAMLMG